VQAAFFNVELLAIDASFLQFAMEICTAIHNITHVGRSQSFQDLRCVILSPSPGQILFPK
jgi:hypothetical protein